ncbi:type II toxin-antitoxin system HicB family antitoxin [Candidatus Amesbacteria bacterium]|nr:type II toxin-antitoxin system HicB family antitoxin [Candidatus Amesbacteria bacterium]
MAKKIVQNVLKYNAVFEPCEEGGFVVTVPKLPGLVTEGDTFEKATEMARDAINGYILCMQEDGEPIPEPDENVFVAPISINFPSLKFAI